MKLLRAALALPFILVACSSSSSVGPGGGGGGGSGGSAKGTILGNAFTPTSAFAFDNTDGSIDLIFASAADACGDAKTGTLRAGGIYVQLYSLTKQADGSWTNAADPSDIKAAQVDPACMSSGTKGTKASSTTVHIDSTSGPVAGSLDLTFADGSTFSGTFSLPLCSTTLSEATACQ